MFSISEGVPHASWFDLKLHNSKAVHRFFDGITAEFVDSFEKVAALHSKVACMPQVEEMYSGDDAYEP